MIAPMVKIQIATRASERDHVLAWLQDEEVLHIYETRHPHEARQTDTAYQLAELQFVLEFLQYIGKLTNNVPKKSWRNLFVSKPAASLKILNQTLATLNISELTAQAHELHENLNTQETTKEKLQQELDTYTPWQHVHITGQELEQARHSRIIHRLLHIPARYKEAWVKSLEHIPTAIYQFISIIDEQRTLPTACEVIVHSQDEQAFMSSLATYNTQTIELDLLPNESIIQKIQSIKHLLQKNEQAIKATCAQAASLLPKEKSIKFAYDALLHKVEREAASQKVDTLPYTAVFTGWIPRPWYPAFMSRLHKAFPDALAEEITIDPTDKPPVHFTNNKLIEPFESVTNLYGKPGYHELDPSGPMSMFFLLAFGLALTDAGYGIVLMIGTLAAEKFFRLKRDMKKMTRLLFLGGLMTVFLGALTGGWFGITLETLSEGSVKNALLTIKIIDPIIEPMKLLGVAFVIGIIQLMFAWVVKIIYLWHSNQKIPAILDNVPWLMIVSAILAWVASLNHVLPSAWHTSLKWIVVATIVLVIATQGRSYKNPLLKIGGGVLSLFGLMSFVSDTLSYSRLLALGLATGIIGFVVNLLAGMAIAQIPMVGFAFAIVILVVGHVFNLGINTLGAFIHSGRLQFVEFFPKFLEGGGLPFRPLGRVSKYVDNPREFSP
ncbi:MAG: hypothetical protein HYZ63_00435 [Candidatus Andersenbacteria bacterium]|nr:hypothetical protein [Candidatus Andersenbacteria bacterium]